MSIPPERLAWAKDLNDDVGFAVELPHTVRIGRVGELKLPVGVGFAGRQDVIFIEKGIKVYRPDGKVFDPRTVLVDYPALNTCVCHAWLQGG